MIGTLRTFAMLTAVAAVGLASANQPIRVVSFNILGYGNSGSAEYNALVRIVQALDADIVMLQEAFNDNGRIAFQTAFQADFPFRALSSPDGAGLRMHTFSRWPLQNPANLFIPGFTRPTLRTDVDIDAGNPGPELRLYNLHLNAGSAADDEQDRFDMAIRIRDDINTLRLTSPDFRVIVAGDFNEQPNEPGILQLMPPVYNLQLNDERDPNNGSFATRPVSGRNIDHFLVSNTVDAVVTNTFVFNTFTFAPSLPPPPALATDSSTASDHVAVVMDFVLVSYIKGDLNLDGIVSVGDIGPFVTLLTNELGYRAAFPAADVLEVGDLNNDGVISVGDIGPFVNLLTGL